MSLIHKEGYRIIPITFILIVLVLFASAYLLQDYLWLRLSIQFTLTMVMVFVVQFFRNPLRNSPQNPDWILAPADGKVVVIEETEETEYLHEKRIQISIFMSPLNVHSNRLPVSGKISYAQYHKGKYLVAWHPKSSTENERMTLAVQMQNGIEILFRQIAGAMARRICNYVKVGEEVKQGNEFGFIKFGSRVDIFLPLDVKLKIKLNDKTVAGETVLAEFVNK